MNSEVLIVTTKMNSIERQFAWDAISNPLVLDQQRLWVVQKMEDSIFIRYLGDAELEKEVENPLLFLNVEDIDQNKSIRLTPSFLVQFRRPQNLSAVFKHTYPSDILQMAFGFHCYSGVIRFIYAVHTCKEYFTGKIRGNTAFFVNKKAEEYEITSALPEVTLKLKHEPPLVLTVNQPKKLTAEQFFSCSIFRAKNWWKFSPVINAEHANIQFEDVKPNRSENSYLLKIFLTCFFLVSIGIGWIFSQPKTAKPVMDNLDQPPPIEVVILPKKVTTDNFVKPIASALSQPQTEVKPSPPLKKQLPYMQKLTHKAKPMKAPLQAQQPVTAPPAMAPNKPQVPLQHPLETAGAPKLSNAPHAVTPSNKAALPSAKNVTTRAPVLSKPMSGVVQEKSQVTNVNPNAAALAAQSAAQKKKQEEAAKMQAFSSAVMGALQGVNLQGGVSGGKKLRVSNQKKFSTADFGKGLETGSGAHSGPVASQGVQVSQLSGDGSGNQSVASLHGKNLASQFIAAEGLSEAVIEEGLTKKEVGEVIYKHSQEIRYCHESAMLKHSKVEGKLLVTFTIDPNGHVTKASVVSADGSAKPIEGCILRALKRWQFPKPRGGVFTNVNYPFIFKMIGVE